MATKNRGDSGSRPNRIRLVVLDADLSEGNLSELTQAITQAIRQPAPAPMHRIAPVLPSAQPANGHSQAAPAEESVEDEPVVEVEEQPAPPSVVRTATRKMPRVPTYLSTMFNAETAEAFKQFVAQHPTKTHAMRYLIAAMWLKEHGNSPTISADKVYTCYRTAGWPTNFRDWDVNFRNHVGKTDRMQRVGPGEYNITPLGEDAVRAGEAE